MSWEQALLSLGSGIVIAVLSSILTVRLALWRFHSEKWWERKAEIYMKILEALHDQMSYDETWLDDWAKQGQTSEDETWRQERMAKMLTKHRAAGDEIRKFQNIGAFVVSETVANDLAALRRAEDEAIGEINNGDAESGVEEHLAALKAALGAIREHAKEDLGIKRKLPPFLESHAMDAAMLIARHVIR